MTSFSHILINMHFSIFIEQKLFEYKIMIKITDNPDVIKIDDMVQHEAALQWQPVPLLF